MQYKITEKLLQDVSKFYAYQAKLELEAKRPMTAIRASWKKVGDSWQPVSVTKQKVRKNYVATGTLVNSIKPFNKGLEFGIKMQWYAEAIIQGRKPWPQAKFNGNKGIPKSIMDKWVKQRNIKPKNSKNGKFIANTEQNRKAMAFMMNRKIKYFGIEPFNFQKIALNSTLSKYRDSIKASIKIDIKNSIDGNFNSRTTAR